MEQLYRGIRLLEICLQSEMEAITLKHKVAITMDQM